MLILLLQPTTAVNNGGFVAQFADLLLAWGWLFILLFMLWIAWEVYQLIKSIDYVTAIEWTYLAISIPDDSPQTPKAMEQAFEVWGGIHKDPDLIEMFFEGYLLAWYSCELWCTKGQVRYIMVVPTVHRRFFEGVIYGQYPTANIQETEDYTQRYPVSDLEKTFDMYGSEIVLTEDDIYPIRTYINYADPLAEDDKFIDPHQALVESFTEINEGEEFWFQMLVKPMSGKTIGKWAERGEAKMAELGGEEISKSKSIFSQILNTLIAIPGEALTILTSGPSENGKKEERKSPTFLSPRLDAEVKGILQKVSRSGFRTKMRVIHIAPAGKLHKPNVSKTIGVFKQFNTFNLNSFKPDPDTKSNGPNYVFKQTRRKYRKRAVLLNYQWRDFVGNNEGFMMTAEELATLWHLPNKYNRSPSISRATSGLGSAPENLPYI